MESLIGYGSDDDYDDSTQLKKHSQSSQADVNYEEVQMDLSEDSNDSTKVDKRRTMKESKYKWESKSQSSGDTEKNRRSSDDCRRASPKHHDSKRDDKYKDKSRSENRRSREREFKKDKSKEDKRYRDDRGRNSRRNRDEHRDDRRSYRESSREKHRSRSPRKTEYGKRSSSRERNRSNYSKRYERGANKMERVEKLGIQLGASGSDLAGTSCDLYSNKGEQEKDRFFMPGITGRFTEQIQRRKLLWQKKDNNKPGTTSNVVVPAPQGQKVWQNTTFAQDTDGKVANKFKRLMGIREQEMGVQRTGGDCLKKQEEMFSSMEAQYEVARTATHTMRGVGLGFGSFQR